MLEARRTDQIICGQVGRADADDVAIAPVVVDIVRPSAPGAASGYVDNFNRYVDERPFRERLGDRASYTIEAASRGRSGNNLYQSIGPSRPGSRRPSIPREECFHRCGWPWPPRPVPDHLDSVS